MKPFIPLTCDTFQAIQQGHADIAKIYAQNAIRKQNEKLNLLRLGSRLDAVSSRVQTAVTMRSVTGSMTNVVKGMDTAMKSMDLEKVRMIMPQQIRMFVGERMEVLIYEDITDQRCHGPLRDSVRGPGRCDWILRECDFFSHGCRDAAG